MKLGKATIYYLSHENEDEPTKVLKETLDSRGWVYYNIFNEQEVFIGEWYDDIDLNKIDSCKDEQTYIKYFTLNQIAIQQIVNDVAQVMAVSKFTGIGIHNAIHMVNNKYKEDGGSQLTLTDELIEEIKFKVDKILETWE